MWCQFCEFDSLIGGTPHGVCCGFIQCTLFGCPRRSRRRVVASVPTLFLLLRQGCGDWPPRCARRVFGNDGYRPRIVRTRDLTRCGRVPGGRLRRTAATVPREKQCGAYGYGNHQQHRHANQQPFQIVLRGRGGLTPTLLLRRPLTGPVGRLSLTVGRLWRTPIAWRRWIRHWRHP